MSNDATVVSEESGAAAGRRISVEFTIAPLRDDPGDMLGMDAILRDTTDRFDEWKALRRWLVALESSWQEMRSPPSV